MDGIIEVVYGIMGKAIEVVYSYEPLAAKTVVLGKLSCVCHLSSSTMLQSLSF